MDVVLLRSMENVPGNFAGAESLRSLANGVMGMEPIGFGHKFAEYCLFDFQHNFNGTLWGYNGPGVITRVAQKFCGTKNISLLLNDRKRCHGFHVFDDTAFYAVHSAHWRYFFQPEYLQQALQLTKHSLLVHVWNNISKQLKIKVGSPTAYGKFAEQNCPKAYAAAGLYF